MAVDGLDILASIALSRRGGGTSAVPYTESSGLGHVTVPRHSRHRTAIRPFITLYPSHVAGAHAEIDALNLFCFYSRM